MSSIGLMGIAEPVLSTVEGPVLSTVEGPVLSRVEGLNPSYDFDNGDQGNDDKDNTNAAWAVRPG